MRADCPDTWVVERHLLVPVFPQTLKQSDDIGVVVLRIIFGVGAITAHHDILQESTPRSCGCSPQYYTRDIICQDPTGPPMKPGHVHPDTDALPHPVHLYLSTNNRRL